MPDIVITWDPQARVTKDLSAPPCGHVHCDQAPYELIPYYTGNHRPNAFATVVGPGVAGGVALEGASILDIAPTLLAHLGIQAPSHMDGRVLTSLVRS
jgi:predicted AlkP superfamily phosphohydrolase/phosphomutase